MIYSDLKVFDDVEEKPVVSVSKSRLVDIDEGDIDDLIEVRTEEEFDGYGFYLWEKYDWVIGRDSENVLVLIPLQKEE